MTEYLVETENLTKRYGTRTAVQSLDLRVRAGEIYGFLGPNGAGKTTTLRMLLGLIRPTSGTARVLGAAPGSPRALARIGMLVEAPAFYPYLSGKDNLRILARYAGVPAGRIAGALAAVDLADRAGDKFGAYSLGMKQRLGVAAALLKDPELLILDEPTNGLDPQGMADMRDLIRQLGSEGHTVMLSSHMLGEVQQICDRVGVINDGKLLREGTVTQLRGGRSILIQAEPVSAAYDSLVGLVGAGAVHREGDQLRVDVEPERAAAINRELVRAGIAVSEIRVAERELEDIFLEMTTQFEEV
jgi:ABC-2 type transport system ATP-binding protein